MASLDPETTAQSTETDAPAEVQSISRNAGDAEDAGGPELSGPSNGDGAPRDEHEDTSHGTAALQNAITNEDEVSQPDKHAHDSVAEPGSSLGAATGAEIDVDALAKEVLVGRHSITREELRSGPGPESLPQELQDAPRDSTVCDYCGVSYLVYSEMTSMSRKLAAAQAELEGLKPRLATVDALQAKLDAEGERASTLAARVAELEAELQLRSVDSEAAVSTAREQMTEERRKMMAAAEERWKVRLDAERERADMLMRLSEGLTTSVPALQKDAAQLRTEASTLRELLRSEVTKVQSLTAADISSFHDCVAHTNQARRAAHVKQVEELQQQLAQARQRESELSEQVEAHSATAQSLTARASDVDTQLRDAQKQTLLAEARARDLSAQVELLTAQVAEATSTIALRDAACASLEEQLAAQRSLAQSQAATIEELRGNLSAQQIDLEHLRAANAAQAAETLRAVDAERSSLQAEITAARARMEAAQQELAGVATQLSSSEERCAHLSASLADREAQCRLLRTQLSSLGEQLTSTQSHMDSAASTSAVLQASFMQSQQELQAAVAARDAAAYDAHQLRTQLESAQQRAAGLQAEGQRASHDRDELVFQIASSRGDLQKQQVRIAQLESEVTKLTARLAKRIAGSGSVADDEDVAGSPLDTVVQQERQLSQLKADLENKTTQIEHLEAMIHQECAERTYLLDELNRLRASAHLPALSVDDISSQAKSYVSPAVQAQVAALVAASKVVPSMQPQAAPAPASVPIAPGGYAAIAVRRTSGSGAAALGLPSPSAHISAEPAANVSLPRIPGASAASPPSSARAAVVSKEDAEWQARRAPVAVAGAKGTGRSQASTSNGIAPPLSVSAPVGGATTTAKQGMSARMAARGK